ncbi:MAG: aminopeptidase P family protein [Caldilineaceae bacterium]|nr:aminopeptidase P family protein [Caldilineaceae bacterium]
MLHQEQRQRTRDLLKAKGITRALFTNSSSVKWLTGFVPAVQLGPNFFLGAPPLVWYEEGHYTVVLLDGQAGSVAHLATATDCEVVTYLGYTIQQPIAGGERLRECFAPILRRSQAQGPIGVEGQDTTFLLQQLLDDTLPTRAPLTPIDGWLVPLRMVKTAAEIQKLRDNFALTDIGHAAARQAVQVGKREIDVWTEIHGAIQQAVGGRMPLGNDCVVGYRENNIGGWPEALAIREHDNVIVDLSTLAHGYWSDSCMTYYAGEPTAAQVKLHQTCADALQFAISLVRPGVLAKAIDQQVRQFMQKAGYAIYPHHTGHGVGVTGHEEPRIVPYNEIPLEAGMVIMLEPGAYFPGQFGARLEDGLLVTTTGAEVLTKHDKRLP